MIAYFAALPTELINVIAHKLTVNKGKDAVLFIDKRNYENRGLLPAAERLQQCGVFRRVLVEDILVVYPKDATDQTVKETIISHFEDMFSKCGFAPASMEEIVCPNDGVDGEQNVYFNCKKIRYTWLQQSKNYCPDPSESLRSKAYGNVMREGLALTPFAEYAEPCLCEASDATIRQVTEYGKEYVLWDPQRCVKSITDEDWERLFSVFGLNENDFAREEMSGAVLVIKNSYGFLNGFLNDAAPLLFRDVYSNRDVYSCMDKVSLDFYAPTSSTRYFKHHIHDFMDQSETEKYYGNSSVSLPNVPFEVLGKFLTFKNIKTDKVIGTASTSLDMLDRRSYNKFYPLGVDFARTWWFYIGIYVSLLFAREHGFSVIYCGGALLSQAELLSEKIGYDVKVGQYENGSANLENALILIDARGRNGFPFGGIPKTAAAIFLNTELADAFFDVSPSCFIPIRIEKEKISDTVCDVLFREETLWVFSRNEAVGRAACRFTTERVLENLGMRIEVKSVTLPQAAELFKSKSSEFRLRRLEATVGEQNRRIALLSEYIASPSAVESRLAAVNDIVEYLRILRLIKSKYLVVLAVCDTPGNELSDEIMLMLAELGFTRFSKELWRMYVGVSYNTLILCDRAGERQEAAVEYSFASDALSVSVCSKAWRQGNRAAIVINGIDFAVNKRGINVAVYDVENRRLVDSIAYDAHTPNKLFFRRG